MKLLLMELRLSINGAYCAPVITLFFLFFVPFHYMFSPFLSQAARTPLSL
jgi:hypothetical protein